MFGYVRPLKCELKIAEFERFQAAYCGLCRTLKKRYGWFASFSLSYDLAFYAAAVEGLQGGVNYEYHRCTASPFKKKCISCQSNGSEIAADLTVVLTYHKLDDAVRDSGGIGRRLLRFLFRRYYKKAERLASGICWTTVYELERLTRLEKERCASLDETADAFAVILSEAGLLEDSGAFCTMLYHVARWIYIVDAFDDLADDAQSGSYNPIAERFNVHDGNASADVKQAVAETLSYSLATAYREFERLDFGIQEGFIENVLVHGLPMVTREVLEGRWKQRRDKDE